VYAVIRTGGKQYRVRPGQTIEVEKLAAPPGSTIELGEVLLVADGNRVLVGKPTVAGAKVVAKVLETGLGEKVVVFKYKPKVRYRRRLGHRQPFTRLAIKQIVQA